MKTLSSELQFDFQLYIVPDGQWGAYDVNKTRWTGLVKELMDGKLTVHIYIYGIESKNFDCVCGSCGTSLLTPQVPQLPQTKLESCK